MNDKSTLDKEFGMKIKNIAASAAIAGGLGIGALRSVAGSHRPTRRVRGLRFHRFLAITRGCPAIRQDTIPGVPPDS